MQQTEPSLLNAFREVWQRAWPLILAGLTTPLLGLVDTGVVGHLDSPVYLAGVALGSAVFTFVFWGFGFLRMGTSGLTAQAVGREDYAEVKALLFRATSLAALLGLLVLLTQYPIGELAWWLFAAPIEMEEQARIYFEARIWAAPAALLNYAMLGWLLGMQRPKLAFWLMVVVNLTNIFFDLYFVLWLEWGVAGAAWASVIAEIVGVFFSLWLIRRYQLLANVRLALDEIYAWSRIRSLLSINRDIFIRTLFLISSFTLFTALGAKFGDVVLAANQILFNFYLLVAYGLDGFAHAAEALVGRSWGRRNKAALAVVVKATIYISLFTASLFSIVYWFFGQYLVFALTDLPSVRETALLYLPWMIISPVIACWSYVWDGVFVGAAMGREMRNTMLFSFLVFVLAIVVFSGLDNHGLWLAMIIFSIARGGSMAWVWRRRMNTDLWSSNQALK